MTSYFERYRQGHYVQVWKELVELGERVRAEPLYSDAQAVARETMRRVRHNVELIHSRLQQIGYEFHSPAESISSPTSEQIADLVEFERQVGFVPLSLQAWVELVGSVNFMGTYPKLSFCETEFNPFAGLQAAITQDGQVETVGFASLMPTQSDWDSIPPEYDGALSSIRGVFASLFDGTALSNDVMKESLPEGSQADVRQLKHVGQKVLSDMCHAFAKTMNPHQAESACNISEEDRVLSDPLVVQLDGLSTGDYEAWQEIEDDDIPFSVRISPDIREKANIAGDGGCDVHLPNAAADVVVYSMGEGDALFVEYLRSSFEWAGFRELRNYARRDEDLLRFLKEGLQPF